MKIAGSTNEGWEMTLRLTCWEKKIVEPGDGCSQSNF